MKKMGFVFAAFCAVIWLAGCGSYGQSVYTDRAGAPEGAFEFTFVNECPWQLAIGSGLSRLKVDGDGGSIKLYTLADGTVKFMIQGTFDRYAIGINYPLLSGVKIDPLTEDCRIITIRYETAKGGYTFYTNE